MIATAECSVASVLRVEIAPVEKSHKLFVRGAPRRFICEGSRPQRRLSLELDPSLAVLVWPPTPITFPFPRENGAKLKGRRLCCSFDRGVRVLEGCSRAWIRSRHGGSSGDGSLAPGRQNKTAAPLEPGCSLRVSTAGAAEDGKAFPIPARDPGKDGHKGSVSSHLQLPLHSPDSAPSSRSTRARRAARLAIVG